MKTNRNGHTLRNLTNRVMAVIDDAEHAQTAVETLGRAGVPERELATLSGTGLSILQRILDLHQGTIRLDSPATTSGLQGTIALPRVVG
jgi:light-regulated signal transduction histidine kinase (bacteriophytochrome)